LADEPMDEEYTSRRRRVFGRMKGGVKPS